MIDEKTDLILQQVLAEMEVSQQSLYLKSAQWCRAHGDDAEALRFCCLAGSAADGLALAIMETEGGSEYYDQVPEAFEAVFSRVGTQARLNHPVAYLNYLQNLTMHDDTRRAARLIAAFRREWSRQGAWEDRESILAELELAESFLCFPDMPAMAEHHRKALACLAGDKSQLFSRRMTFTFGAGSMLYLYHHEPGRLDWAVEHMEELMGGFIQASGGCGAGAVRLARAEYALERGDMLACRRELEIGRHQAQRYGQNSVLMALWSLRGRLALAEGSADGYALARKELLSVEGQSPVEETQAQLCAACLDAVAGEDVALPAWIESCDPQGAYMLSFARGWRDIVFGKVLALRRRDTELAALGESMLCFGQARGSAKDHVYAAVYAHLFKAIACRGEPDGYMCQHELRAAVDLAEPDGLTTPFTELAAAVLPLLLELAGSRTGYVRRLADLCREREELDRRRRNDVSADALSRREWEMLEALAEGLARSAMARRFGISDNTVKTYLARIYEKLGVHCRADAISWYKQKSPLRVTKSKKKG